MTNILKPTRNVRESLLYGHDPTNSTDWYAVRVDSSGNLNAALRFIDTNGTVNAFKAVDGKPRVSAMPYLYDIAEGNVSGHVAWNKYAINDDVDSAAEEDIWSVGGSYVWPTAKQQMEVISSSVQDGVGGTGIQSVRIHYLDDSFVEKTTDVTMNGTTAVPTSVSDIYRINRIRPLTVGTGLKAAGNIDVRNLADTPIYSRIATGFTKGRQLVYTVPTGKALFIAMFSGSIGGTTAPKFGRFTLRSTWDDISLTRNAWMTAYGESGQSSGFFALEYVTPLKFPAGSDIIVSCKTLDDNCYVTGSLRGWQETA